MPFFVSKKELQKSAKRQFDEGYLKGVERGHNMVLSKHAEHLASQWAEIGKPAMLVEIENLSVRNKQLEKELLIAHDRIDQLKFTGGK